MDFEMDIKKEPDDEKLSMNLLQIFEKDTCDENNAIKCEVVVKREEENCDFDDYKDDTKGASFRIKSEFDTNIDQDIFKQEVTIGVCAVKSEVTLEREESTPSELKNQIPSTNSDIPVTYELPSTSVFEEKLNSMSCIEKQYSKTEILEPKLIPVVFIQKIVLFDQNFVCKVCFKVFPSSKLLKEHITMHLELFFNTNSRFKESISQTKPHLTIKKSVFKCDICNYKSTFSSNLKAHKVKHTNNKPFKCNICSFESAYASSLITHRTKHMEEKTIKTDQKKFQPSVKPVLCDFDTGKPVFKCDQCEFTSAFVSHVNMHKIKHVNANLFRCERCNLIFSSEICLKTHILIHNNVFKCIQCNYNTSDLQEFELHERKHAAQKVFSCGLCSYKSIYATNLKTHQILHTGEKPFKCDVCSYETVHAYQLKNHTVKHTGKKPFMCDKCDFKSAYPSNLRTHSIVHSCEQNLESNY